MRSIVSIVICVFIALFVRTFVVQAFKIPGSSMTPALLVGDQILVNKNPLAREEVQRGDIVVFKFPEDPRKDFVKRIIGLPGETIHLKDRSVSIDGREIDEPYAFYEGKAKTSQSQSFGPYMIPEDAVFVMGDNRNFSYDSRFWGPVPLDDIKGKVVKIYWSFNKDADEVRWERCWTEIN